MEKINTNVFASDKKFIDIAGLSHFWTKTKTYVDEADTRLAGKITLNENAIKSIQDELDSLSSGDGSIATQIDNAITALDLPNTYEAKGEAAKAESAAKAYADSLAVNYDAAGIAADLNTAMDARVKVLEAIDHTKLAEDASAAAVATVLDGAPEKFDTLKEVAQWIADSESAATAADLVTRVNALEEIDHNAYKDADDALVVTMKAANDLAYDAKGSADAAKTAANTYTDNAITALGMADYAKTADVNTAISGVENAYKAADTALETSLKAYADQAEVDAVTTANAYADGLAGNYDAAGAAAQALADAKADADAKLANYTKTTDMNAAIEAAKNAAIADADAKLTENSAADQAYAKAYTDALFDSFQFAGTSDIDALFV